MIPYYDLVKDKKLTLIIQLKTLIILEQIPLIVLVFFLILILFKPLNIIKLLNEFSKRWFYEFREYLNNRKNPLDTTNGFFYIILEFYLFLTYILDCRAIYTLSCIIKS